MQKILGTPISRLAIHATLRLSLVTNHFLVPQYHAPSQSPTSPPPCGLSRFPDIPSTPPNPGTPVHLETKSPRSCFDPNVLQPTPAVRAPPARCPYFLLILP